VNNVLGELDPCDLLHMAVRMAQELQEFCDEADEGGTPLKGVQDHC